MSKLINGLNLYQFCTSKRYLPALNQGNTWLGRNTILAGLSGMPLGSNKAHDFWETATGGLRYDHKTFVVPQNVCIVGGRTSAKSLIEAMILTYRACTFDLPLIPGNTARNAILCPSIQSGMPVFEYSAGMIEANKTLRKGLSPSQPWQNPVIKNRQQGLMKFSNRTSIEILPVSRISGRGISLYTLCLDESAHHRTDENSRFSDEEVYKSAKPALSRFGMKSMCLMCSTPYDKSGLLWKVFKKWFSVSNPNWIVFQVSTRLMNPTIDEAFLRAEEEADPEWFKREYEAMFTEQKNACFPAEAITDCTVEGRRKLPYDPRHKYFAFIDPASLSLSASSKFNDEFCCGIGHNEGNKVVIDVIRAWSATTDGERITPDDAVAESIEFFRNYRIKDVEGDKYGSGYIEHKITDAGFKFSPCKLAKSDLYLAMLPLLNGGKIELLDDPILIAQLKGLERKRGQHGKEVAHELPDRHDDRANTVAGLAHICSENRTAAVEIKLSDVRIGGQRKAVEDFSEMM